MKAIMNKETVEVNIKEQLAQLISKYNASQQSLADNVRALNQKYKEDVQAKTYTPEHLRAVYEENKATLLAAAAEKAQALCAGKSFCRTGQRSAGHWARSAFPERSGTAAWFPYRR